jgi:hypothetical protein
LYDTNPKRIGPAIDIVAMNEETGFSSTYRTASDFIEPSSEYTVSATGMFVVIIRVDYKRCS